jgi:hypothetical protein
VLPVILPGLIVQGAEAPVGNPVSITDPVATVHVGCVIVNPGLAGDAGWLLMTTLLKAGEVHEPRVTVKLYVPGGSVTIMFVPVPVVVPELLPVRFNVHVPVLGSPPRSIDPVLTVQVGWMMPFCNGAVGVGLITKLMAVLRHPGAFEHST